MYETLKVIGSIIVFIVVFLFLYDTTISFNPFKIEFHAIEKGIGWLLVLIGITLISHHHYNEGYNDGYMDNDLECIKNNKYEYTFFISDFPPNVTE